MSAARRFGRDASGLTIIEMLITVALAAVASVALITFLLTHVDYLDTTTAQGDVRSRAQLAIDAMLKELRHGTRAGAGSPPNVTIPAAPNNTQMTFYVPSDLNADGLIVDPVSGAIEWGATAVTYQYDAASRQLRRVAGGATRVLAHHVSSVTFEDQSINATLNANEVRIRLVLDAVTPQRRTISTTAAALVKLRN